MLEQENGMNGSCAEAVKVGFLVLRLINYRTLMLNSIVWLNIECDLLQPQGVVSSRMLRIRYVCT